ncbi:MAG TPA: 2-C-methyl-D-erythritol 4-phosphate cytidylyltransferase [Mycobacteriales bacterium]|nr:2-C-methyl-D-erythritol 4-phosphate cytidylyltransferase [Mycobacteriales bacterium]
MTVAAVVPAAGRGERLGPGLPKALRDLGTLPLLVYAVRALALARRVDVVVVAAPPDAVAGVRRLLSSHDVPAEVSVVPGGATRQESVAAALAALAPEVDVVLVHDAARPLAPSELADAVAAAVLAGADAVVPALPMPDTVKRVDAGDRVVETLDRAALRAVQTPQGFRRAVLAAAHERARGAAATDDAGLVEAMGITVRVIPGHPEAFKITRPLDLVFAEAVLATRRAAGAR